MSIIVYGPYTRKKDRRQHVVLYNTETGTTTSQSYPRFLMERKLGRKLLDDEDVDHIDTDKTNNKLENLQVLTKAAHKVKTSVECQQTYIVEYCFVCKEKFYMLPKNYNANKKRNKRNTCSTTCAASLSRTPKASVI